MGTGYTRNDTDNNIADGNVINAADFDGEFDAIVTAFSTSGHTHDGTSAEGGPVTVLGPAQDFVVSATTITPKTTNTLDLGTSSLLFKDAFFDGNITTGGLIIDNAGSIGSVSDTNAITISSGGVVAVTATTASSSATTGALTVAGGAGVAADLSVGDDLRLISDSSVLSFGADSDTTLTHTDGSGLTLNSTNKIMFNDASQFIQGSSGTVLSLGATDEIDLTASTIDINGNLDVSGTIVGASTLSATTGTFSGILKTDDTTEATSTTDGSLQTDGGLSVAKDAVIGDDLKLLSDSSVLSFGADSDTTLTHTDGTGLTLNSTNKLTFGDADSFIQQSGDGTLRIDGEAIIDLNASTRVDVSGDLKVGDDLSLASDSAVLSFGADSEITVTHVADTGLTVTNTNTGDNKPTVLQLKSEENEITANEVIGSIEFAAGDDSGTDAATVAAGIHAIAEAEFTSSVNSTKLVFTTGASETAAASATAKMTLSSAGLLTIADDFMIKDGGTIGVASTNDAITISSAGIVTFKDDIIIKDGGTIGSASDTDAIAIASTGLVSFGRPRSNTVGDVGLSIDPTDTTVTYGFRIDNATNSFNIDRVDNTTNFFNIDSNGNVNIPNGDLTITSTDAGSAVEPVLTLDRNSSSPAVNDQLTRIEAVGRNDAGESIDYVRHVHMIRDPADGSESGRYAVNTIVAGTQLSRMNVEPAETVFNDESADIDFRVESNNNTSMLHVDGAQDAVLIGHNTSVNFNGESHELQVADTNFSLASFATYRNGSDGANISLGHSRNATKGSHTVVNDDDQLGAIAFYGSDGTDFEQAARIEAQVDGTPNNDATDMPGKLIFSTTADGSDSPTERMRIDSSGRVGIGTAPDFPLHVSSTGVVFALNSTSGAVAQRFNENGTARFFINTLDGSNGIKFVNGDGTSERMRIDSSGNVGIGQSPNMKLNILHADEDGIRLNTADGAASFIDFGDASDNDIGRISYDHADNHMAFRTNNAEAMRIDSSGRVTISQVGTDTTLSGGQPALQVTGSAFDGYGAFVRRDNGAFASGILLAKSRGTTADSFSSSTKVQDNDQLGSIIFIGDDGTDLDTYGATITAQIDGTPSGNNMPTELIFSTNAGAASPTERMTITSGGDLTLATGSDFITTTASGSTNTRIGTDAGDAISTGADNILIGENAGGAGDNFSRTVAIGRGALASHNPDGTTATTTGHVAIGYDALTTVSNGTHNVAVGYQAGLSLTTGNNNVAIGSNALDNEQAGRQNVAIGNNALGAQRENNSNRNVAVGHLAGQSLSTAEHTTLVGAYSGSNAVITGDNNTCLGYLTGFSLTSGSLNTFVGANAGDAITTGFDNVAIGRSALTAEDTGRKNVAIGSSALEEQNSDVDNFNVAVGFEAGKKVSTGVDNTFIGSNAGDAITTGANNVAIGTNALGSDDVGKKSVAIGNSALFSQNYATATDSHNVAIGNGAGYSVSTSIQNTLIGSRAGENVSSGSFNTMVGYLAGGHSVDTETGTKNTIVGSFSHTSATDSDNQIVLGHDVTGSADNTLTFGVSSTDSAINFSDGAISQPSDERYKEDIVTSTAGLSFVNDLRPVTFKWKKEKDIPTNHPSYVEGSDTRVMLSNGETNHGFIAQEVKAAIDAHSEIKDGFKMWSVDERKDDEGNFIENTRQRIAPSALIPILTKAIQELSAKNDALEARIATLEGS